MRHRLAAAFLLAALSISASCGDSSIKYYNLGVEAAQRNDIDEAIAMWRRSLEIRPDDPDTRYNLGMALLEKKQYAEAQMHFERAAAIRADDYELQYALGRTLEMQGDLTAAKKAYRFAVDLRPNSAGPNIGLASIALAQKQYASAEKYATEALRFAPRDPRANLILSESFHRQGNNQAAYAQLISARSYLSGDPDYLLLLGEVMNARRMFPDALSTLLLSKDAGQESSNLYYGLGVATHELQMYRDAEEYFRLALFRDKSNAAAWRGLARTRFELGDMPGSLDAWKQARTLEPDDGESELGIAIVHIRQRDFERAAAVLVPLSSRADAPPRTLYYLGHTLMRLGRTSEAKRAFERFLDGWQGEPALADEVREILVTL